MEDCLFCKIASGEIPSDKVYEDELIYVFKDIAPAAPLHYLFIPKEHISGASEITPENSKTVSHIFEKISDIAKKDAPPSGFRVITNCGEDAGQTVNHLHFHLLAGKKFTELAV